MSMRALLLWLRSVAKRWLPLGATTPTPQGQGFWAAALGPRGVLLAVVILLAALLLPLPAVLLDVLLLGNLSLAVGLLWLAVRAGEPQQLPQLPALLVVSILLRLGLNVAAVRLILTDGYAGRVIETFGSVVVRGDVVVGTVVFLILAVVQYLVLARGGERVAEVAARFVLDALPGRQAAIEADLRAGAISFAQGQQRRLELEREAQVYGAMDGALRLVKGDVVASLLVLALGLAAGLGVGVLREDLGFAEAAQRYALLTLGDGLVTQVPVLLGAVAAALLLTRGVHTKAAPPAPQEIAPTLQVFLDPGLGLTEADLQALLRQVARRLGLNLPTAQLAAAGPRQLRVQLLGATLLSRTVGPDEDLRTVLTVALQAAAAEFLTLDELQKQLDALQTHHPALLREVVPRRIDLPQLGALLRRLLDERVWPLDLRAVLEAVAALPVTPGEPLPLPALVEQVRARLGRFLVSGYVRPAPQQEPATGDLSAKEDGLPALLLDAEIEELLRDSRRGGPLSETLALEPELSRDILQAVLQAKSQSPEAVLLCHGDVRVALQRLLAGSPEALPVLAYSELPPSLPVLVVGRVSPGA